MGQKRARALWRRGAMAGLAAGASVALVGGLGMAGAAGLRQAETVQIARGTISIPQRNVGSVDLTRLPLGNGKVSTSPAVGMLYLCNTQPMEQANPNEGSVPWISGTTFDLTQKVAVQGDVAWSNATYSATAEGATRVLAGNSLPVGHNTGVYPAAASDPASAYRATPSSIAASSYRIEVPANPAVAATTSCLGGEVGVAITGIPIYNAVDAQHRDAVGEEVQDRCFGHPNAMGYHYHTIPDCMPDTAEGHSAIMGYAFDGFGIYGHRGENGQVVTNADLDDCHGHTHAIEWDGQVVELYHYHATWEFPYTVGCFRGTSTVRSPAFGTPGQTGGQQGQQGGQQGGQPGGAPAGSQPQGTPPAGGPTRGGAGGQAPGGGTPPAGSTPPAGGPPPSGGATR